ncbi:MAG: squalene--hopene cyclase [Pirellulaceae bacterium]|nr:squalene--hopene cyclase [Pirellulaceae bacterium]
MIDPARLLEAYERARRDLLAERNPPGCWTGKLSTSALSTATAVSALAVAARSADGTVTTRPASESPAERLVRGGVRWLVENQNQDGGWGDTPRSYSNIATTMLVQAALHLAGEAAQHAKLLERAARYVERQGGVAGLRRRYGRDKTFAVPILTNAALAGLVPWSEVAALPFELACVPQSWYRFLQLPVVSYAIPALVAVGQAGYCHRRPGNPLLRALRARAVEPSLRVLRRMQPASGGYLEAIPLTSFVVMSLASTGRAAHPVVQSGLSFIEQSVREDGSWPIDTNLATWNTTLAINALGATDPAIAQSDCLTWLLSCQHAERHPFTGAEPGGWGWSDLSGAVPDADDTPGALLALHSWLNVPELDDADQQRIDEAARLGCQWLLGLQNRDGGWPTFCRGWGKLPFDRSGADLTAHALRALAAWRERLVQTPAERRRWQRAIERGLAYLIRVQQPDGSWIPLWFGNQDHPLEENPVYGTAKVLLACRDLGWTGTPAARRGSAWLAAAQRADGGWGGGPAGASVEETALATEALLGLSAWSAAGGDRFQTHPMEDLDGSRTRPQGGADCRAAAWRGVGWLVEAVEGGRHQETWPIGFYFAKLWYYEELYPLTFTVAALAAAVGQSDGPAQNQPASTTPTNRYRV